MLPLCPFLHDVDPVSMRSPWDSPILVHLFAQKTGLWFSPQSLGDFCDLPDFPARQCFLWHLGCLLFISLGSKESLLYASGHVGWGQPWSPTPRSGGCFHYIHSTLTLPHVAVAPFVYMSLFKAKATLACGSLHCCCLMQEVCATNGSKSVFTVPQQSSATTLHLLAMLGCE